jgi:hypothetical protein
MGQKMVCFGQLRPTRSRQDESIEVGEVGSKRPSLGGTGGHVVWCSGLIFWLLANTLSTFAASQSSITQWRNIVAHNVLDGMTVTGYAGDISSMFDKLDGVVVLKALAYVLERAASLVVRRYNLRRKIRRHTYHLTSIGLY